MTAGLTRGDRPALAGLKTRDPSDFSLALIDAWAVAADVLTFYTERIANEKLRRLRSAAESWLARPRDRPPRRRPSC